MFVTDQFNSRSYDCFVVGSGPAGLSLALALAEARKRVLVFESGGESEPRSELSNTIGYGHYSGEYWNGHWWRALGGTSNVWTGWCTTLRPIDFDNPAVGVSWPVSYDELLPYWKRAAPILDRRAAFVDFEKPLVDGFVYRPVQTGAATRFSAKYGETVRRSPYVDVALGRSIVGLDANPSRTLVTRVEYVDHLLDARRSIDLAPHQTLVLAAGGMGNAELLLQPRGDGAAPVGNESGEAGKYLMEHPQFNLAGECVLDAELDKYWPAENPGSGMHVVVADAATSREHRLHGCSLQCSRKSAEHEMARFLSRDTGRPFFHYEITARSEMLPSPANRVFVMPERNRWGLHRLAARCVLDARDFMNVEQTLRVFGETLMRLGRGRVRVNNDRIYKDIWGEGHTVGTTRMGTNPATSVVDRDCRVHGYENFYLAGSSVFPSGGYANPTLTIVALALRLADTLIGRSRT